MNGKFVLLAVFAAILSISSGSNSGCPHPTEARNLILQEILVAPAPNDGRHIIDIEIPAQVISRTDLSCITILANQMGATPDMVSFGRNMFQGYSILVHSRVRSALNSTLFIYTQ